MSYTAGIPGHFGGDFGGLGRDATHVIEFKCIWGEKIMVQCVTKVI